MTALILIKTNSVADYKWLYFSFDGPHNYYKMFFQRVYTLEDRQVNGLSI